MEAVIYLIFKPEKKMKNQTVKKSEMGDEREIIVVCQGVKDAEQDINSGFCCGTSYVLIR